MKFKSKEIIDIINNPSTFGNINNLSDNIIAYGQLEFMEGYLNGIFGILFREILDSIDSKEIYNEYIYELEGVIKSQSGRFKDIDKVNGMVNFIRLVLLHNIYKKNNIYKLQ